MRVHSLTVFDIVGLEGLRFGVQFRVWSRLGLTMSLEFLAALHNLLQSSSVKAGPFGHEPTAAQDEPTNPTVVQP